VENSNSPRADFDATITRENAISNSLGGERCSVPRENRAPNNFPPVVALPDSPPFDFPAHRERYIVSTGNKEILGMTRRFLKTCALLSATVVFGLPQNCVPQDRSGNDSWTSNSQQQGPSESINPTRTSERHSEGDGRAIDKRSVETIGPDGRYVPYQDTEKETVKVDATTVRNIERTYGRGPDGERILIQESREESHSLPGGGEKVDRTISSPDGNGKLQAMRRELQDSKETRPGMLETKTTVLTPDINGGLAPAVQIEESQKKSGAGTIEFKKSTLLSDGTGGWQLSEVREGTSTEQGGQTRKEESVLRPDSNGKLETVERTVTHQTDNGSGEKRETVENYSNNLPGTAADGNLHLVQRETNVLSKTTTGEQNIRQIERPNPGDPSDGLHVTEEAIDIVRTGSNGSVQQKSTILTGDSEGSLGQVWIDMGKTNNPAVVQVDTAAPAKPH
jgi:hypothetical protein